MPDVFRSSRRIVPGRAKKWREDSESRVDEWEGSERLPPKARVV